MTEWCRTKKHRNKPWATSCHWTHSVCYSSKWVNWFGCRPAYRDSYSTKVLFYIWRVSFIIT